MMHVQVSEMDIEKVRLHFERNDWLTLGFLEVQEVLGLTHSKSDQIFKILQKRGFLRCVSFDEKKGGKYRYEPKKNNPPHEKDPISMITEVQSTPVMSETIEQIPNTIQEIKTKIRNNNLIFTEAFQVLKDLSPTGATVDELHELIGRKGKYQTLSRKFHETELQGLTRSEKVPQTKNLGKGYLLKRFWVADPTSTTVVISHKAKHKPVPAVAPPVIPITPAMIPAVTSPLLTVSDSAPTHIQSAIENFNLTYVETLKKRLYEIEILLKSIEPLVEERKHIEDILRLPGYQNT